MLTLSLYVSRVNMKIKRTVILMFFVNIYNFCSSRNGLVIILLISGMTTNLSNNVFNTASYGLNVTLYDVGRNDVPFYLQIIL